MTKSFIRVFCGARAVLITVRCNSGNVSPQQSVHFQAVLCHRGAGAWGGQWQMPE